MGEQLQAREVDGRWLSPAEQLGVLLFAAAWRREHGALPAEAPVRPLLGPDGPPVQAEPGEVECPALLDAAVAISPAVGQAGRVPAGVRVGAGLVGPAVLLRALGRALADAPERVR